MHMPHPMDAMTISDHGVTIGLESANYFCLLIINFIAEPMLPRHNLYSSPDSKGIEVAKATST